MEHTANVICQMMRNCRVSTAFNHNGVTISVGIAQHGGQNFLTCCVKDFVMCQHLTLHHSGAWILMERVARAFLLLAALR